MKNSVRVALVSSLVLAVTGAGLASAPAPHPVPLGHLVYQLRGTAVGVPTDIDTDGDGVTDTTADCFEIGLFDPTTGIQLGTARDCLSDVNMLIDDDPANPPLGWNIALTGTTFFDLPFGTLVTQGLTTVRPVLQPTTRDGIDFSHITGANGDGGVMYGTDRFEGLRGTARLSGMVDLARLGTHGEITFDCLFVIDLDR